MHAAPRLLAVGGATSSALVPARGILQGCMHSFYLSRSVTHKPIARLVKEQREERFVSPTITSSYVDDLVQWSIGLKHNIYKSLLYAGVSLAGSLRVLNLITSSKSTIVTSCPALSRQLSSQLFAYTGRTLVNATSARNLGILYNPTRRRSLKHTKIAFSKGHCQTTKSSSHGQSLFKM